jgi:N-acetylglucosamine-6-sulfatase
MAFAYTVIRKFHGGALTAAALALVALATALPEPASAKPPARPNVVVIVTDDQAAHTLRREVMPSLLDRIGRSATSFTNAIATTPLCCPSRASMLTGQYGHNNGVLRNDYSQLNAKGNILPVWLQRAGYRTIHVGKYLNRYRKAKGPDRRPARGWDVWQTLQEPNTYYDYQLSVDGRSHRYGNADRDYVTDVLTRRTARLIRRYAPDDKPFYLQLDEWAPHYGRGRGTGSCEGGRDPVPAPSDGGLFANEPLPQPPSFNEEDVSDKPSFVQHQGLVELDVVERNFRCMLASLRAVDRGIERVHRVLQKTGELNDTVIVFTSDNGYLYGEHRLRHKTSPYDEALRVPLMISVPPRFRGGATPPTQVAEPVANIDIAPTILELARATPCRPRGDCRVMDGRSLVPLLRGAPAAWPVDRALALEYTGDHHGYSSCNYRGLRVGDEIYVEHSSIPDFDTGMCEPGLEVEHYDLGDDPFQLDNIAPAPPGSPAAAREEDLADRLVTLRTCAGIAGRDPAPIGRTYCE